MEDLLEKACGLICHQRADRTWWSGGALQPVCQRCFGILAGLALAPLALLVSRLRASRAWDGLHAALVVPVLVLGLHLLPHGPEVSTLSGQLLAVAVGYLGIARRAGDDGRAAPPGAAAVYVVLTLASIAAVQAVCRAEGAWAAAASVGLVAGGLAAFALLLVSVALTVVLRVARP